MKPLRLYQDQAREHPGEAKYMLVANAIAQGVEDGLSCARRIAADAQGIGRSARRDHRDRVKAGRLRRGRAARSDRGCDRAGDLCDRAVLYDVDVYEGAGRMQ